MSVGGSETRSWEVVKEGPGWWGGGCNWLLGSPTIRAGCWLACVSGERVKPRSADYVLDHEEQGEDETKVHVNPNFYAPTEFGIFCITFVHSDIDYYVPFMFSNQFLILTYAHWQKEMTFLGFSFSSQSHFQYLHNLLKKMGQVWMMIILLSTLSGLNKIKRFISSRSVGSQILHSTRLNSLGEAF